MAVNQLSYYSNTDTSIIDLQNTATASYKGLHTVSLTNYDTTGLPAIAVGSIVENNGSLFEFDAETAISGSPSDGTVYIYLVPSGDPALGTATVTPTFTNTSPTWSNSKQGWYGTGGSANYRYLEFKMTKASTSYLLKNTFKYDTSIISPVKRYADRYLFFGATRNSVYDFLAQYLLNTGDKMKLSGGFRDSTWTAGVVMITSSCERTSANEIEIYGLYNNNGSLASLKLVDGNTTDVTCSIAI